MLVSEIFLSIQGESTFAGFPCVFVRLAGCNLDCAWCDTPYAKSTAGATAMSIDEVLTEVGKYDCNLVEVTGGEPLIQDETNGLLERLLELGYKVLLETNGSVALDRVDGRVVKIVDVKCPSSGAAGSFLDSNTGCISETDEIKFVIGDKGDYDYAVSFIKEKFGGRTDKVLFAPVTPDMNPKDLAEWILADGLAVRMQMQMHRFIWKDERGR